MTIALPHGLPVVSRRRQAIPAQEWGELHRIELTVPGQPVPKARPRWAPHGNTYTAPRTCAAEERIRSYLKVAYPHQRPSGVLVGVTLRFYLRGARRGDWDNYAKLVCDALNGCVWLDDKQVWRADVELFDGDDEPRTEIEIYPL